MKFQELTVFLQGLQKLVVAISERVHGSLDGRTLFATFGHDFMTCNTQKFLEMLKSNNYIL